MEFITRSRRRGRTDADWQGGSATRPIRRYLLSDLYKPHTFEEVRELVSTEVAAALKPEKCYDVWWGAHGCTAAKSRSLGRTAAATGTPPPKGRRRNG
jgi:hypothetical protein